MSHFTDPTMSPSYWYDMFMRPKIDNLNYTPELFLYKINQYLNIGDSIAALDPMPSMKDTPRHTREEIITAIHVRWKKYKLQEPKLGDLLQHLENNELGKLRSLIADPYAIGVKVGMAARKPQQGNSRPRRTGCGHLLKPVP